MPVLPLSPLCTPCNRDHDHWRRPCKMIYPSLKELAQEMPVRAGPGLCLAMLAEGACCCPTASQMAMTETA